MDANESKVRRTALISLMDATDNLLFKHEAYRIVGCAMEVLNALGHGLHEKPYENALVVEFEVSKIPCLQQTHYDVVYKGVKLGEYVPDLIAFGAIVVEAKVVDAIGPYERGQMLNYLKISGFRLGLILNFKHPKLEWERIVLEKDRVMPHASS
jgi:GxxExxY protein